MSIEFTDPGTALVVVAVALIVLWLLMFTAARVAVETASGNGPLFAATTSTSDTGVHFTLANLGVRPAFRVDVSLPRAGMPGPTLASVDCLTPLAPIEWDVELPAIQQEEQVALLLLVQWRSGAGEIASRKRTWVSFVGPSRLQRGGPAPTEDSGAAAGS